MDELRENVETMDFEDEEYIMDDQTNSTGLANFKAIGAGAAVIGIGAGLLWRKFGGQVKQAWHDHEVKSNAKKVQRHFDAIAKLKAKCPDASPETKEE